MKWNVATVAMAAVLVAIAESNAATTTYSLNMTGSQETGAGDPDGLATGFLSLDDATGGINWSFVYSNISPPTLMHIHGPGGPAGTSVGIFVGLGVDTSGAAGTLIDSTITTVANVNQILANPLEFYVNIHNADFGSGAVRGQLGTLVPEPSTWALATIGLLVLRIRRR